MGDKFLLLLRESILVQATISLVVIVTLCLLYLRQIPVPSEFLAIAMLVIGFYFGERSHARADSVLHKALLLSQLPKKDDKP